MHFLKLCCPAWLHLAPRPVEQQLVPRGVVGEGAEQPAAGVIATTAMRHDADPLGLGV